MVRLHKLLLGLGAVSVVALVIWIDNLGILTGIPQQISAFRIAGFACIAIGIWFALVY